MRAWHPAAPSLRADRYDVRALGLRALVLVLPLVALACGVPAGATPRTAVVAAVAVLALAAACFPDNVVVAVTLVVVVGWWAVAVHGDDLVLWTLPASAALAGAHVAATLAASAPVGTRPHPRVLGRWLVRWVVLVASALAALGLVLALRDAPDLGVVWPVGVLLAGAATALARVVLAGTHSGR